MYDARTVLLMAGAAAAIPLRIIATPAWDAEQGALPPPSRTWAEAQGFKAASASFLAVPDVQGGIAEVLVGLAPGEDGFALAKLARQLPKAVYAVKGAAPRFMALAWGLEAYGFERYRPAKSQPAQLIVPAAEHEEVVTHINAIAMVRDLINTPANDMGPDELEAAARTVAAAHGAALRVISGEQLAAEFPLVHHVGVASPRAPRLIDFTWGRETAPLITLVGKGVCFDTGGLDIKGASNMALMKKDMGGAANVLGLAQMIMAAGLDLRLRVIIPAVENAIAGNAFRPGDILKSRKGLTVEIGNTDAEGRLILADALALADEETPDLLIDMATLTGAARVALGPDLPPFYTPDEGLAADLGRHAESERDPMWRLPLWAPYNSLFDSSLADLNNSSDSGFAGSITAALFLRRFVEKTSAYVHFDVYGWNPSAKAGSPRGGEAQCIRALYALIAERIKK